jgi:hypothetical protein
VVAVEDAHLGWLPSCGSWCAPAAIAAAGVSAAMVTTAAVRRIMWISDQSWGCSTRGFGRRQAYG